MKVPLNKGVLTPLYNTVINWKCLPRKIVRGRGRGKIRRKSGRPSKIKPQDIRSPTKRHRSQKIEIATRMEDISNACGNIEQRPDGRKGKGQKERGKPLGPLPKRNRRKRKGKTHLIWHFTSNKMRTFIVHYLRPPGSNS